MGIKEIMQNFDGDIGYYVVLMEIGYLKFLHGHTRNFPFIKLTINIVWDQNIACMVNYACEFNYSFQITTKSFFFFKKKKNYGKSFLELVFYYCGRNLLRSKILVYICN